MGTNFEQGTQRYLDALRDGAELSEAMGVARVHIHRDAVFDAAIDMLETTGEIDMKQLAVSAGISRASLYRYYPDKLAVDAEIAGSLAKRAATASAGLTRVPDKLRATIETMIEFPAGAAALGPVVAEAAPDVIAESCRIVVGHRATTPVVVGFAAIIAAAHRRDSMDQVTSIIDTVIAQFELSLN